MSNIAVGRRRTSNGVLVEVRVLADERTHEELRAHVRLLLLCAELASRATAADLLELERELGASAAELARLERLRRSVLS